MAEEKKKKNFLLSNIVMIPVVVSILVGSFSGVKYVVNLTDTINASEQHIVNLERDLNVANDKIADINGRLSRAEATWEMAENLYRTLAETVREHGYDIKDLAR
jgi:hypothetical protein|tara:strand:- start:478 stop:789 length:312 start_codon:yes stop_codon:yes gene_type:complete